MKHTYDQRFFRTVGDAPGGETVFGTLLAKADEEGRLDMRYQQPNRRGEWLTGDRSSGTFIVGVFREGGEGT